MRSLPFLAAAVLALSLLTGCDSAAERAAKHVEAGMALVEQGDDTRAALEFRNALQLDPRNHDGRLALAQLMERGGQPGEAYAHYRTLVEQNPEDLPALTAMARIAALAREWTEAGQRADAALALDPDLVGMKVIRAAVSYNEAVGSRDDAARREAARAAEALRAEAPDDLLLARVAIDNLARDQNYDAALEEIAKAQKLAPEDREFYGVKLGILGTLGDNAAIETTLKEMVEVFPDEPAMRATLVRWYVSRDELQKAEDYLRAGIPADDADPLPRLTLIRFLAELRGRPAAIAELDAMLAQGLDRPAYRALRAGLMFEEGDRDEGLAEMEALVAAPVEGEQALEEQRNFKVALARMRFTTGNAVGARALVEEVLASDSSNVEALKLKAAWLVQDDKVAEAVSLLRAALEQSPRDPQIMTLMATAYERDGNRELMADMLARAVEASNKAPAESIRYADHLAQQGQYIAAEAVLIDALKLDSANAGLLLPLGRVYVAMEDWDRAGDVARRLEGLGTPEATAAVPQLRTAILSGRQDSQETLDYLQGLAESGTGGLGPQVGMIRLNLTEGKPEEARRLADELVAADPQNPERRFIRAAVLQATGEADAAEAEYRALLAEDARRLPVWLALYRQLSYAGRTADADALIDEGLKALPEAPDLLWAKAGILEREGDIEGAIAIYQGLYDRNSSNLVVANNLASLLSSFRDDPESLERAFTVGKRLRGTTVAPFQDTFGWILVLRGEAEEALTYLEPAAAALPNEPLVQYHLAEAYARLDRGEKALEFYRKTLDLAPEGDTRPFVDAARGAAERIESGQ